MLNNLHRATANHDIRTEERSGADPSLPNPHAYHSDSPIHGKCIEISNPPFSKKIAGRKIEKMQRQAGDRSKSVEVGVVALLSPSRDDASHRIAAGGAGVEVKSRGWRKTYLDLDRGAERRWGVGEKNVRDGEVADRIGEARTPVGEGRRRNYNRRGTEARFACLPWTITEFRY